MCSYDIPKEYAADNFQLLFFFSPVGPFLNILTHFSFLNSFTLDILKFGTFSSVSYLLLKQFENFSSSIVLLYY